MNILFLKNKVLFYLASRYITYAIQFVTSLVIAAELGPYYMGIWGFVLLILNYFQQFHFGISQSFNILYVQHREDQKECDNYIGNSLTLYSYLAAMIVVLYVVYLFGSFDSLEKYNAHHYMLWVCIIAILQHYSSFFTYLFRVKNLLNHVTFCQSIIIFLNFICVFVFHGETLIMALIAGYVIGNLFAVVLALISGVMPGWGTISINWHYQGTILRKGVYLFLYNSCFYFIIISIRTIISGYYTVGEFGMFTFSFSLAHAILLLLEALSFVIFPKVLSKLSSRDVMEVRDTIVFLRKIYITFSHFLIYLALPIFPVLMFFFPKYEGAIITLNLIALSIVINTNSCGYSDLLMAKNKEKGLMMMSLGALLLNCVLAIVLVIVLHVGYSYVILATLITYFVYSFCVMVFGERTLERGNWRNIFRNFFPIRLALPYFCALTISLYQINGLYMIIPLLLFLVLNIKTIGNIKDAAHKLFVSPNVINL